MRVLEAVGAKVKGSLAERAATLQKLKGADSESKQAREELRELVTAGTCSQTAGGVCRSDKNKWFLCRVAALVLEWLAPLQAGSELAGG